jgi:NADPH:quinone reductase-like Zn-dependent oxidoreductase
MRGFAIESYDRPLRNCEVAEPALGDGDVLVRVEAAGLNALDEKIRTGEFKQLLRYDMPLVLGNDLAGTVIGVGSAVRRFEVGDEVFARPDKDRIGTFAERIAVAEADLAARPTTISMAEAGSLPLVSLTAWQALVERGNVQPDQRVLVHGGAGGVGSIAIQLAKHLGATVATTVSTDDADFVRDLGADTVIDYRNDDFTEIAAGYDVVLDSLGGDNLLKSLSVLRPGGIAIGIAGPPDPAFARELGLNRVLQVALGVVSARVRWTARRLGVGYQFLFMHADGDQLRRIAALVDEGAIRPVIGRQFPFDETPAALEELGTSRFRGKAVITVP